MAGDAHAGGSHAPPVVEVARYEQSPGTYAMLPDPVVTPGAVRADATRAQLCAKGFTTKRYRHTTAAMKREVYRRYGLEGPNDPVCSSGCEVDHLIPLTLGGDDVVANLWPEPAEPLPGFHQKDKLEVLLHRLVCKGLMELIDAQKCIGTDWLACWKAHAPK